MIASELNKIKIFIVHGFGKGIRKAKQYVTGFDVPNKSI